MSVPLTTSRACDGARRGPRPRNRAIEPTTRCTATRVPAPATRRLFDRLHETEPCRLEQQLAGERRPVQSRRLRTSVTAPRACRRGTCDQLGVAGQPTLVADRPEPGTGQAAIVGQAQLRGQAARRVVVDRVPAVARGSRSGAPGTWRRDRVGGGTSRRTRRSRSARRSAQSPGPRRRRRFRRGTHAHRSPVDGDGTRADHRPRDAVQRQPQDRPLDRHARAPHTDRATRRGPWSRRRIRSIGDEAPGLRARPSIVVAHQEDRDRHRPPTPPRPSRRRPRWPASPPTPAPSGTAPGARSAVGRRTRRSRRRARPAGLRRRRSRRRRLSRSTRPTSSSIQRACAFGSP